MKILISDAENRKTFDIVNIVLKYHSREDLLITGTKKSWLLNTIYPKLKILGTTSSTVFEDDLKKILIQIPHNEQIIYLPIEEETTHHFYTFVKKNKELKNRFHFLLPPEETFNLSRNKYLLNLFCTENDIVVPAIINRIDTIQDNFRQLIYKPRIGTGSKGISIIKTTEELNNLKFDDDHFLQYFIGNGITVDGGFYLMNRGNLVSFYSHQRIRTYPPEGGVSVFSKSAQNDRIKDIGVKLLQKLNWSGWAMIEFIYNEETDEYMVIEINPRAWGSILLSEINQSCFIENYIQLSMGMQITQNSVDYNTYIRWLIPWDIILYIKKLGKIKEFWKFNVKKTGYIGFTYSNIIKSFLFIVYSMLNMNHLKKIIN